jgi:hypothetical protein
LLDNIVTKEVNTMKLKGLLVGLFGFISVPAMWSGLPGFITPASAQCVMTDVSAQVAIRGSKRPSHQENNVDMQDSGNCSGNSTTQTSTQVYAGSDEANQVRNSRHSVGGGEGNGGPGGPTVKVPVGVKVDVYNPASDPNFMNGLGR